MSLETDDKIIPLKNGEKPKITPDNNPEKQEIIENAEVGRLKLLGDMFKRLGECVNERVPKSVQNTISHTLDFTIIAMVKMATEAFKGKTLAGQKLNAKDRIMYGLIVATGLFSYILGAYGVREWDREVLKYAAGIHVTSWVLLGLQKGPQLVDSGLELAKQYNIEPLIKFFGSMKKIIEKYGDDNFRKLIEKIKSKFQKEKNE